MCGNRERNKICLPLSVQPACNVTYLSPFADRKSCENLQGKPDDIAYNATSFTWCPEQVVKVSSSLPGQPISHSHSHSSGE